MTNAELIAEARALDAAATLKCPRCGGDGWEPGHAYDTNYPCGECSGTGGAPMVPPTRYRALALEMADRLEAADRYNQQTVIAAMDALLVSLEGVAIAEKERDFFDAERQSVANREEGLLERLASAERVVEAARLTAGAYPNKSYVGELVDALAEHDKAVQP